MSYKSPGYRQVEWTATWGHPLEFWLVRNSPVIADPQANVQQEQQQQVNAAKREERAREVLRNTTALFGEPPRQRLCPCQCGVTLMRGMSRHPEMDAAYEEQWEFTYQCARGEIPGVAPKAEPAKAWAKAVSIAQLTWARRQLQYLDAGGKVDQPREALVALAETDPIGLPERAAKKAPPPKAPTKKATTPKAALKAKAKEAKQAR
jgi:hypothetical protein